MNIINHCKKLIQEIHLDGDQDEKLVNELIDAYQNKEIDLREFLATCVELKTMAEQG